MAKEKRVFTGGMDKDSEPRLIKQGDYRHAENIRNIASSDGTSGSVENIEGNKEVIHPFINEVNFIAETTGDGVVTSHDPGSIFYSQEIYISGREIVGGKYNFSLHSYDENSNLVFSGINLSWDANEDLTATADYLHSKFNANDGTLSSNIPLINRANGEVITGHSEVFLQNTETPFTPSTSMGFGATTLVIRITADLVGIDFDLDFKSSYSSNPNLDLWINTVNPEYVNGRFYIVSDQSLHLGSSAGFEETDDIASAESEDGSPVGLINTTDESSEDTEVLITFSGTLPTTPQDPTNNISIYSVALDAEGNPYSSIFVPDKLDFSSDFNSGDPFEINGDYNELSQALVDKFTNLEADVLVAGQDGVSPMTLKTTSGNFVTGFDANTKLRNLSRSIDYDYYVVQHFTSESDFTDNEYDFNFLSTQSNIFTEGNSLVFTEGTIEGLNFPIEGGIIEGKQYKLDVNISTFSAAGLVLKFRNGNSESEPISTTNSSFSFSFEGSNFPHLSLNANSVDIPEGGSIIMQGITLSQHRSPSSSLQVLIKHNYDFNLVFATSEEEAENNFLEGKSTERVDGFLSGVDVVISKGNIASSDYTDLIGTIAEQDETIEELEANIASLNEQLSTLTEEYNNLINTLNAAAALDSATAYSTLTQLSSDLSDIAGNNDLLSGILSDVNTTIGNLNIDLTNNQEEISQLQTDLEDYGGLIQTLTTDLSDSTSDNANLTGQVTYLANLNADLEEEVLNLQDSVNNSIGSELVLNGTFDTDSDWTKEGTWTISGETANRTALSSGNELKQTFTTANNKNWLVSFEITSITEGGCGVRLNGNIDPISYYTKVGIYTEVFNGNGSGTDVIIQSDLSNPFAGSIDNVSVKEVSEDYVSLLNELATVEDLLSESDNILSDQLDQISESGLSLTDLISGYNSATSILGSLVSSAQGMITTINSATLTDSQLTEDLQNDIASLEGFIQAAVNAANSLETDNVFNTIQDYSDALGTLQSEYTGLVSFISSLNTNILSLSNEDGSYNNLVTNLDLTLNSVSASNLINNISSLIDSANNYSNQLSNTNATQVDLDTANANIVDLQSQLTDANSALETLQNAFPLTNLITNGDFDNNSDTGWSELSYYSINEESLVFGNNDLQIYNNDDSSKPYFTISTPQTSGRYVLSFNLSNLTKGGVNIQVDNDLGDLSTYSAQTGTISTNGFYTSVLNIVDLPDPTEINLVIFPVNIGGWPNGASIDNISLVKVPDNIDVSDNVLSDFADQINALLLQVLTLNIQHDNLVDSASDAYQDGWAIGFSQGVASVDITSDNQAAYAEGAASVDITSDNEGLYALGMGEGYTIAQNNLPPIIDDLLDNTSIYQLQIMNLLGLIEGLTGQTIGTLQGTVADAQVNIETIANTTAQTVLDQTDSYTESSNSIQQQIDALILAAENLANNPTTTQTVHDTYTFVVYGESHDNISFYNAAYNKKLYLKNQNVNEYVNWNQENYVVDLLISTPFGVSYGSYKEVIISSCHNFGYGDSPHYNVPETPHSHYKTIAIPGGAPAVLKLTIENFNLTSGSISQSDISGQGFQDDQDNDINNGLKFTVTVLSGPSGWEFAVTNSNPFIEPSSVNNILSNSTINWHIFSDDPVPNYGTLGSNILLEDGITTTDDGDWTGNGNWNFNSGDGWGAVSNNNEVEGGHFLTKSVNLDSNTVYEIEFKTLLTLTQLEGLKVDLGSNLTSQTKNTVISEGWGEGNIMLTNIVTYAHINNNSLSHGEEHPLRIRISTGVQYNANIIRFSAAQDTISTGAYGFTGWLRNVTIKEVTPGQDTPAVDINLLGEKTSSASQEARSSFLNTSRAYTGASRRIVKNPLKATPQVNPILALGYTCIGTYEDKPNNKLYYFVVNEEGAKKYDCILEYDLMSDSIETVYQDDRPSSNFRENNILNFEPSHLITGVNKVDDILYFTDNLNRPRKINVELGKQNERNISNCKFIFKDFYYKSQVSTVFIGIGSNNHPFKAGDHIYAQSSNTTNQNLAGLNGYAKVLGVVRKPLSGITFTVSNGSSTITASSSNHGLNSFVGDFIGIQDNTNLPYYYQIQSISGATIELESNYVEGSVSGVTRDPVKFPTNGDQNAVGLITDCPWPGSSTAVDGKILYADPSSVIGEEKAYSPLISYGSYHEKSKYFDVIKHQPERRPVVTPERNSSFATNNILDNLFQFKYRYLHVDEETTSYSAISDINIDPIFALNSAVSAEDYNAISNMLKVRYEDTISDVDTIEIVARKGNDGEFFLVDTIQNDFIKHLKRLKNELIADSAFEYSEENTTSVIPFYNNGIYPFVDKSDSDKLFDAVPKLAKAQTILSNNRLAYGNVLEGYDNTKVVVSSDFTSDTGTTLTSSSQNLPTSAEAGTGWTDLDEELFNFGGSNNRTKHTQKWNLSGLSLAPDRNQSISINYAWTFEHNGVNRNGTFNITMDATNIQDINLLGNNLKAYIQGGLGDATFNFGDESSDNDEGGELINIEYINDPSNSFYQHVSVTFRYSQDNSSSPLIGAGLFFNADNGDFNPVNNSSFISGDLGLSSFKSGAFHNFGIAYFDETNRCSFVNAGPDYNINIDSKKINGTRPYNPFYTENGGPSLSTNSRVEFSIYNKPPVWATNYQMYYTGNTTVDEFIQMTVVNAIPGAGNDDQIYLSLQSLKGENWSYNESNNSQLEYNFVKGDRVRFISFDSGSGRQNFTEYVDLEIAGDDLYVDGDENSPIGTITSSTSGFYIRVNDPEQTAVSHSGGGTVNISHSNLTSSGSTNDTGYESLVVEIYRPKKTLPEESMVYYEVGDKLPIINSGKVNRSHSGVTSQTSDYSVNSNLNLEVSLTPAIVIIETGDVYLKPRLMATTNTGTIPLTFFPEDYYLNDFHQTNHYSKGRVNVINTNANERRLEASVYYSETYSSTASINGLSNFNLANSPYYDYNKNFGSIQSLQTKDTDLIIFHENKVGRVLVGKDILNTASGEGLVSLSTNIIDNYATLYAGEYGCCIQPESVVKFNNKFYFVDIKRGAVLRLSTDGLTVISDNGMRDYFRDIGEIYVMNDPESQPGSIFKIVAGYDAKYDEYIVTFPDIFESKGRWSGESVLWDSYRDKFQNKGATKIYDAKTIAFNERTNRWTSFYTFYPEFYGSVGRQFIGFEEGRLFKHNLTDRYYTDLSISNPSNYQSLYNNLYSTQYASTIQFPFNAESSAVKAYNSITLEGDSKWFTSMYTNIGQTVQGPTDGFRNAYENTISTDIGYRRVDGKIKNYNGYSDIAIIEGVNTKFFKDIKKGDIVKIYGLERNGSYSSVLRIAKSVISNNILYLDAQVGLTCDNHHMEVLDYKTKEGIHYSSIPFVSSMESVTSLSGGYAFSGEDRGDGSEFFGVGKGLDASQTSDGNFKSSSGFNPVNLKTLISPNQMIVGAEYVLYKTSDGDFSINEVSSSNYDNVTGTVFTCENSTDNINGEVLLTDYKLYLQYQDGSTVFLGYPYSLNNNNIYFVKSSPYPSSYNDRGFLFIVKDGNVEGEKMKGSYMMTTLSTDKDTPYKSKYKHNLYGASVDVDKSELSDK